MVPLLVRNTVDELLAEMPESGDVDIVEAFTNKLPIQAIAELLRLPSERPDWHLHASREIGAILGLRLGIAAMLAVLDDHTVNADRTTWRFVRTARAALAQLHLHRDDPPWQCVPMTLSPEDSSALIRLRDPRATDLRWMAEVACDRELVGPHNWGGEPRDRAEVERDLQARFDDDGIIGVGSGTLIVELDRRIRIGDVSWRTERWGPSTRSSCPAIGVTLLPEHRGQGYGTTAQRLLVDRLFERDAGLHRVQSDTADDNIAEQRALSKVGMTVEGRVRDAEYRDGQYHDHLLYSILRAEWESPRSRPS